MQQRVAPWITNAFCMLLTMGVEAIAELVPIHLHLKKLYQKFYLQGFFLLSNHIIKSILIPDGSNDHNLHRLSLENFTVKQRLKLKSLLIDIDNMSNEFHPSLILIESFPLEIGSLTLFQNNFSFIIVFKISKIILKI